MPQIYKDGKSLLSWRTPPGSVYTIVRDKTTPIEREEIWNRTWFLLYREALTHGLRDRVVYTP